MIKVLFVTEKLQSYRIPIFEIIGSKENIDLTVAHSGKALICRTTKFTEAIIDERHFWKFSYHGRAFITYCEKFDVVVCMAYIQKISFIELLLRKNRKCKVIFWGIGVNASQSASFDAPTWKNRIRYFLARRSDASIFYSDYARNKHLGVGVPQEKLFVMPNTVEVLDIKEEVERDCLLFVGTLNRSKKIFELLSAYKDAVRVQSDIPVLNVIGAGRDFDEAAQWVSKNDLEKRIKLLGPVYDESELSRYFSRAILCISPGQAGLSVLKSMGYGVPFVTNRSAITGGERLNISHKINGLLFSSYDELTEIIIGAHSNRAEYLAMGKAALEYYRSERTPEIMADGFIQAVNYVTRTSQ
jgi:glycosyltransferase involved in cell wall biosynthesis